MGQTIRNLAKRELDSKTIFNNRFVIEFCEKVHVHYRNMRIVLSIYDFVEMANGFIKAFERWNERGCPEISSNTHIELCRKKVGNVQVNEGIQINLNKNLYLNNEGKIYAEGAQFNDPEYIHLKIRDVRVEMSIPEFKVLAEAVKEAYGKL